MRLRRLDLTRYGKFTDRRIDFGPAEPGRPDLHIVYGPNEAGKSTALSGFLDLLFGIETRSRYNFVHPYGTMRVGGRIEFAGGEQERGALQNQPARTRQAVPNRGGRDQVAQAQPLQQRTAGDASQRQAQERHDHQKLGQELAAVEHLGQGGHDGQQRADGHRLRHIARQHDEKGEPRPRQRGRRGPGRDRRRLVSQVYLSLSLRASSLSAADGAKPDRGRKCSFGLLKPGG